MRTPPEPRRLHPFPTFLSWIIVGFTLLLLVLLNFLVHPLDTVEYPERSLNLIGSRSMELFEARQRAPEWERRFYGLYDGYLDPNEETQEVLDWHKEMAGYSKEPAVEICMAVLAGETARGKEFDELLSTWPGSVPPLDTFFGILSAAYGREPLAWDYKDTRAIVEEVVPAGWFRDRLLIRLAGKDGDFSSAVAIEETLRRKSDSVFFKYRMITLFDLLLSGLFLFALALFFRKYRGGARIGAALIPPPWRGRTALVVLARGAALGSVIGFFTILFAHGYPAIETAAYVLCSLPIILLAKKHLFTPNQLTLRDGLGLKLLPGAAALLGVVALAGIGLDLAGNWCVNLASMVVEFPSHWSESFDSTLIWGNRTELALGVMGNVLMAPFFEEIIFRGLVFGSLRRKFSWTASALISAGVFSALHGYGALGFLLVFWSGFVWAWMYEKSGSLLPGMLGHCMNNLIFSITQILFLRMS